MPKFHLALLLATSITAASVLVGCAETDRMSGMDHGASAAPTAAPSASAAAINQQDVMFAQSMLPHHEQAVAMADLLLNKPDVDARVQSLASQIRSAQSLEITTMKSWLARWGAHRNALAGMDQGTESGTADGMMSKVDMTALATATGTTAERLFLKGMITHHQGAIAMAQQETSSGADAAAVALAKTIVSSQTAEIQIMKSLLAIN